MLLQALVVGRNVLRLAGRDDLLAWGPAGGSTPPASLAIGLFLGICATLMLGFPVAFTRPAPRSCSRAWVPARPLRLRLLPKLFPATSA